MKTDIKEKDGKPVLSIFTMNPHAPYNEEELICDIIGCFDDMKGGYILSLYIDGKFFDTMNIPQEEFIKHETLLKTILAA